MRDPRRDLTYGALRPPGVALQILRGHPVAREEIRGLWRQAPILTPKSCCEARHPFARNLGVALEGPSLTLAARLRAGVICQQDVRADRGFEREGVGMKDREPLWSAE
jgi:hypothetical protein